MPREKLELSCVPAGEECQQVGMPSYDPEMARKECEVLIRQLRRMFGEEPYGARLGITSNPHDFGSYLEVVCYYSDEEGEDYAYRLEAEFPEKWDNQATIELERIKMKLDDARAMAKLWQ